jgi:hypothetical protein
MEDNINRIIQPFSREMTSELERYRELAHYVESVGQKRVVNAAVSAARATLEGMKLCISGERVEKDLNKFPFVDVWFDRQLTEDPTPWDRYYY